ncbi:MAG: 1-acyl-sn-glycerol-3-phosphate acyltransferase [Chloroflexota bacterium]|nr:1-acyl-sn-glycerol-3-phosphate acyltransferase [Chloroflexota bacterium]
MFKLHLLRRTPTSAPLPAGGDHVPAKGRIAKGRMVARMRVARWALRVIFRLVWRVRVTGLARLPAGPCILCPNHLGWTDAFLVLQALPPAPPVAVVGESAGVLRDPLRLWLARTFPIMVPLDRRKPAEALRRMHATLAQGRSLILFPEGNLGTTEGALLPLQAGAAHLSVHTGLPLVPVGLTGTHELWLRRTLTVRIGVPLYPDLSPHPSPKGRGESGGGDLTPQPPSLRRKGEHGGDDLIAGRSPKGRGELDGDDLSPNPSSKGRGELDGDDLIAGRSVVKSSREQTTALTAALTVALRDLLPGDRARARWKPLARWLTDLF